jgi:hypothetical protein
MKAGGPQFLAISGIWQEQGLFRSSNSYELWISGMASWFTDPQCHTEERPKAL